jgi:predicted component of type VI protein secretion system
MKSESGNIYVINGLCCIQGRQLHSESIRMQGQDPGRTAGFEELSKPFMPAKLVTGALIRRLAHCDISISFQVHDTDCRPARQTLVKGFRSFLSLCKGAGAGP